METETTDKQQETTTKGCDCLKVIREKLAEFRKCAPEGIHLGLKMSFCMDTGKSESVLPPLEYSYPNGKKRSKGYVVFNFCPFCGKPRR